MQLSMVEESDIDATLDARIKSGLCRCFPKDAEIFNKSRGWHGNMPDWSVIIRNGEEIAAHLGITDRTILVGKQRSRVAGIHNVFVLPEYRGKSLTKQLLDSAMFEANKREYDFGFLFCKPELEAIYAHHGWITLTERKITLVDNNNCEKTVPDNNFAMYFPLVQQEFPKGHIHLQGNDW